MRLKQGCMALMCYVLGVNVCIPCRPAALHSVVAARVCRSAPWLRQQDHVQQH